MSDGITDGQRAQSNELVEVLEVAAMRASVGAAPDPLAVGDRAELTAVCASSAGMAQYRVTVERVEVEKRYLQLQGGQGG